MSFDGLVAFYHSSNLDATHEFYHDMIGLPLYKDQGACRIYRVRPGSLLGFCDHFPKASTEGIIITLLTDDVDGIHDRMSGQPGVEVESAPRENPRFGIYHFFLRDPDGYKVEIQKFLR